MPKQYTSPFATSFKSAMKRGTSFNTAVQNSAKRNNKTPEFVWESLFKANLCFRQKINGQWVYWPCEFGKSNAKTWKNSQWQMWQWFTEWCILNGCATPTQFKNHRGSQQAFMTWARRFWSKQFNSNNTPKKQTTKRKRTTTAKAKTKTTRRTRKTTTKPRTRKTTSTRSYKFPTAKSRTSNRRWRRAA